MKIPTFARFMLAVVLVVACYSLAFSKSGDASMTSDAALSLLKEGNLRFSQGKLTNPNQGASRRTETADHGQKPFTIVLSCADSRVPLDLIFDRGIGDIFGVRVAGNVAGIDQLGSIEYGVEHLGIPLVVVLGHSKCGAVGAVVEGEHAQGNLRAITEKIVPAVDKTRKANPNLPMDELVDKCSITNVQQVIQDLSSNSAPI